MRAGGGIIPAASSRVPAGWDCVEGGGEAAAVSPPYIVSFPAGTAQVIVHSADCREALRWLRDCVFTGAVAYVCSDFEGNHTFEVAALAAPVVTNA